MNKYGAGRIRLVALAAMLALASALAVTNPPAFTSPIEKPILGLDGTATNISQPGDADNGSTYGTGPEASKQLEPLQVPCPVNTEARFSRYVQCVSDTLADLKRAKAISKNDADRLYMIAIIEFFQERRRT